MRDVRVGLSMDGLDLSVRLEEARVSKEAGLKRDDVFVSGLSEKNGRVELRLTMSPQDMTRLAGTMLVDGPPLPDTELSALYWGDGDWTCSFECGALHGDTMGWFSDSEGDGAEERARSYWESDDSPTYSVFDRRDIELLPERTSCEGCGKELRP